MNPSNLEVPITNFACLSSLTDLLPELPLPGPAPVASSKNNTVFFDQRVAEDATRTVLHNDQNLAGRLSQALSSTNVEHISVRDGCRGNTIPATPLTQAILSLDPTAFGQPARHHNQVGSNSFQNGFSGVSSGSEAGVSPARSAAGHTGTAAANSSDPNAIKINKMKINMGLSKEDQALMAAKLSNFNRDGSTNYNNFSPRAKNRAKKYAEPSGSESDSDSEAESSRKKSKFFKHTEKERDSERRRRRDERRRRDADDDDYVPTAADEIGSDRKRKYDDGDAADDSSWLKRRRKDASPSLGASVENLDDFVPKKVSRKIERKLGPRIQKIDPETLMESSNFQRFNRTLETIFDQCEEVNMKELEDNEDGEIPPEVLVPKYQASDLVAEAAKLKSLEAMSSVPTERLVKILNILQWSIRDGSKVSPLADPDAEDEEGDKLFVEVAAERANRAADCAMTAMYIMTSKNMNKRVYIDDVIDKVSLFVRFQLQNTIYPSYDPVYREMSKHKEGYTGSMKKKRNHHHIVRDRKITSLYSRCNEIVGQLSELLQFQLLTDTTVLHLSTLGVAPFFVENVAELQLNALKLVTGIFSKYDKHRKLILDDILASIARLPSTKHSLRTFRLSRSENIQMLTALVLQLIQCVVNLPARLGRVTDVKVKDEEAVEDHEAGMDRDVLINNRYENAMATAVQFLSVFLKKCGSKSEETDFRPLFENFLQDLLTTVNTPEWPAAELLLSLLGKLLVSQFANKGTEVSLRISSLDYLGMVASRLRRDAVQSKLKLDTIDSIIQSVKDAEGETGEGGEEDQAIEKLDEEEKRTRFLQRVLLDYLTVSGGEEDPNNQNSRHFYISQWFRDANAEIRRQRGIDQPKKKRQREKTSNRSSRRKVESESESSDESEPEELDPKSNPKLAEVFRLTEDRKSYLTSKILPFGDSTRTGKRGHSLTSHIDNTSATLIVKYLSSKRPFFNSFDIYLKQILSVLTESSIQVRSKALKCLASVVHEDPSVLSRDDMQRGVSHSFLDQATMVREAAVDLVGKFILHRAELIDKYYKMLSDRIMDIGVSVRKRVIKILKDICIEFPDYPRIPAICVKMIRRIGDEEGIRKLVMEVFQNMWFVPINDSARRRTETENHLLVTKAHNITDVVVSCRETGLEWFEQLLQTLFRPKEDKDDATKIVKEPPKQLVLACQQIVDCLVETVLKTEERSQDDGETESRGGGQSHRIVACLTTTYLFAKIRPQLLIHHVQTLQPYLNIKCHTKGDYEIISNVARTLELVVPLIEHPSEIFLSQLEAASVKLIIQHDKTVVFACLSCLGSVVNNVTKNFSLMRDCFKKYFGAIKQYKKMHQKDPTDKYLQTYMPYFKRSLFTVGLLFRHFDFSKEELYAGLETGNETISTTFDTIYYFMDHELTDLRLASLQCLGNVCIRHYDLMLEDTLKERYIRILTRLDDNSSKHQDTHLVLQVLTNIENYLVEEERRMIEKDKKWKETAEQENLKEMGDVSSGMASTIIQIFLKPVLESFIHHSLLVRHAALKVIQLILGQGLVHPVQIVPYLICMSTDSDQRVSHTSDRELQEIEKKYPGFIHMKLMHGIRLSYQLQKVLSKGDTTVLRGYREKEGELPTALNGFLYSCLRSTKAQRRAILGHFLKQFDDALNTPLSMMLYLADNLAYIPYTVIDEPLYLIHHIDLMVSLIGTSILQSIKDSLALPESSQVVQNPKTGKDEVVYDEDLDDDESSVLARLPEDLIPMQKSLTVSQGILLLLVLREHLKELYAINEAKIASYSPSESQKIYERAVNRKGNARFQPKATVEILKNPIVPVNDLDEEGKRELIRKYLGFKELMNRIEKDDDEYDEDGNLIVQTPVLNAKELQSMGMPPLRQTRQTNGDAASAASASNLAPPDLPPGIQGRPESFNPVIRLENIPVSSLPSSSIPMAEGYLDPSTGEWITEIQNKAEAKTSVTPLKLNLKERQEAGKITPLKIQLGQKEEKPPQKHAFFADLDRNERERAERRRSKPSKSSHQRSERKKKKKKKKKKYGSDSEETSSGSDSDYME